MTSPTFAAQVRFLFQCTMAKAGSRRLARSVTHTVFRAVWLLLPKPARTVHIAGLRRCGNHACINWLANAVYGHPVDYLRAGHYLFRQYPDNGIFLINSYAQVSALTLFWQVWKHRKAIARSQWLFLSLEDQRPGFDHFLRPRPDKPGLINIHVDRTLFNMLASRAKKIEVEQAKPQCGIAGNFRVDGELLAGFFAYRHAPLLHWAYDRWLVDAEWRREFLRQAGLKHDILPGMSREAGGSSFGPAEAGKTGNAPMTRFRAQAIPPAWLCLVEQRFIPELGHAEARQWHEIRTTRTAT